MGLSDAVWGLQDEESTYHAQRGEQKGADYVPIHRKVRDEWRPRSRVGHPPFETNLPSIVDRIGTV